MNSDALSPAYFVDSDHPRVKDYARAVTAGLADPVEQTRALFLAVRDSFPYDPYKLDLRPEAMKASEVLLRPRAYCVEKAVLLAATLRSLGLPSRLFFGNVRNHIGTGRLERYLGTNVMAFHGSTEVFLQQRWIKLTPAFNKELCAKLGVAPLDFDGESDAIFQEYSGQGRRFMEYLTEHGSFADLPYELYLRELREHYGRALGQTEELVFDFSGKV